MRLAIVLTMFVLLLIPALSYADPIAYRIHFATTRGEGSVDPITFSYDENTTLFGGDFQAVWNVSYGDVTVNLLNCGSCIPGFGVLSGATGVNGGTADERQSFFTGLLDGGQWSAADSGDTRDTSFTIDGYAWTVIGTGGQGGPGVTAKGSGVFKTLRVPEPRVLSLLALGMLALVPFLATKWR